MTTTAPAARRVSYRQVLAEPRFRLLFLTRSLAIGADTLRTVALSVLIFTATGSPLLAALTYGAAFLPQAIGGTLLGAMADRLRPRPLITSGYCLEAAAAAALALAGLPTGASLALVAVIATLTPVFGGASSRLIAESLGGDAYVLGRSLANIAASAAQLLGLAAGGAIVAALGTRHALLVTAACHLVAAAATRLRLADLPPAAPLPGPRPGSVLRQSWAVNRQLVTDPAVRILLLATWLPPAFLTGAESLIVPYAAQHHFGAGAPGLLLACVPAGMIAGDFASGRLLRAATRERLTIPLMMVAGLPLLAFAAGPALPAAAGLLAVTGIGPAYILGIQRRFIDAVPPLVLGQAFGLLTTGLMTFQGAGPALFGAVTQITPPGQAMALAGAVTIITALSLYPALAGRRLYGREVPRYHPPMTAPDQGRIRQVQRRLRAEQGAFAPKPVLPVIDEVVATVLSQHTSDINSERAFAQLKERFPDWEQVAAAPAGQVADAIRCGGIADQKARRIQQILAAISEREGRLDLGRLHDLDDEAVRTYLESLPGVGPKTAACVLTFAMGRAAFPVDTHVHRVATRLAWLPPKTAADRAHRLLGPMVPADIRYDLHVAMIGHGRTVCRAQRPRCGACVLNDLCPYGRQNAASAGQR